MSTVDLAQKIPRHSAELWIEWANRVNMQQAFPQWRIWRATHPDGRCGSWVATNRCPAANDLACTLIAPNRLSLLLALEYPPPAVPVAQFADWYGEG